MGFHHLTYPIITLPSRERRLTENCAFPCIEMRKGWTDETYTYGFFNTGKMFVATDLRSGRWIVRKKTRKECVAWIEENKELLEKKKNTQEYQVWVEEFEALKRCEL